MRASNFSLVLAISSLFLLSGCSVVKGWLKKPVDPTRPSQIGQAQASTDQATANADRAVANVDEKVKEIGSAVRANIQNAREENKLQPPGPHTESVEGELSLADKKLTSVPVDPVELALGQARREANLKGKTEAYQELYEKSSQKSESLVKDLSAAMEAKDTAIKERDLAREREKQTVLEYEALVKKNAEEFDKKWKEEMARRDKIESDLKDGIARKTQLWLTMGCYALGVACFIFAAIRAYMAVQTGGLGFVSAAKASGIAIFCGACFFALGRLTAQPWFWYACGTILALSVVSVVVILIVDARKTKKELEDKKEIQDCTDDVISGVEELRAISKNPPESVVLAVQQEMGPNTTKDQAVIAIKASLRGVVDPTLKQWVTEGDGVAEYVDSRRRALELLAPAKP